MRGTQCRETLFFRLPSSDDCFLCLRPDSNLADFCGDAIITSTNTCLQGIHQRNWWGFSGKRSADASLHENYLGHRGESRLAGHCRGVLTNGLPPGECLLTETKDVPPSPGVQSPPYSYIAHIVVPNHPDGRLARETRPLSGGHKTEFVDSREEAENILHQALTAAFVSLNACNDKIETVALPAVGCGCRGYPAATAIRIILDSIVQVITTNACLKYIEIRFCSTPEFLGCVSECTNRSLIISDETEIEQLLFGGMSLAAYTQEKKLESCPTSNAHCTLA